MKHIIKFIIVLTLFLSLTNCGKNEESATYKYEVKGIGDMNVVIQSKSNAKDYYPQTPNNWSYTWNWVVGKEGRYCYISAKNNPKFISDIYDSTLFVTVKLYKNGKVVAENTSVNALSEALISGAY